MMTIDDFGEVLGTHLLKGMRKLGAGEEDISALFVWYDVLSPDRHSWTALVLTDKGDVCQSVDVVKRLHPSLDVVEHTARIRAEVYKIVRGVE